jgi:predicted Zn-dependent protease
MSYGEAPRGSPLRFLPILLALIAAGVMVARGCDHGPFGRRQLRGISSAQEAQLGAQAFQQVLSESSVVSGGPVVDAIGKVARRLADAAERPDVNEVLKLRPQKFDWQFRVVRSNQVNAFCLPGGKIVVYTGILPVAENEAGLATVIGHEIGHALAHHSAERMAQTQLVRVLQAGVAGSLGDMDPAQRQQVLAAMGVGSNLGLLKFSRNHESEADHIGLLLMAAAGYDPREAARFWQRMEKAGGSSRAEFLSTHPSHEHRAQDLSGPWLQEAMQLYERSKKQDGLRPLPRR